MNLSKAVVGLVTVTHKIYYFSFLLLVFTLGYLLFMGGEGKEFLMMTGLLLASFLGIMSCFGVFISQGKEEVNSTPNFALKMLNLLAKGGLTIRRQKWVYLVMTSAMLVGGYLWFFEPVMRSDWVVKTLGIGVWSLAALSVPVVLLDGQAKAAELPEEIVFQANESRSAAERMVRSLKIARDLYSVFFYLFLVGLVGSLMVACGAALKSVNRLDIVIASAVLLVLSGFSWFGTHAVLRNYTFYFKRTSKRLEGLYKKLRSEKQTLWGPMGWGLFLVPLILWMGVTALGFLAAQKFDIVPGVRLLLIGFFFWQLYTLATVLWPKRKREVQAVAIDLPLDKAYHYGHYTTSRYGAILKVTNPKNGRSRIIRSIASHPGAPSQMALSPEVWTALGAEQGKLTVHLTQYTTGE